ncbi:hypothetical protein FH972_002327 [Carpinus fangiana]|uniref:Uncharacterized protein n=1 Tax=Carpinus fangiana TaxID=176857 RepID=A0A5N6QHU3_9ROSI|nr:hypothetical protein FH972_002327 [Carpinus fangiana]
MKQGEAATKWGREGRVGCRRRNGLSSTVGSKQQEKKKKKKNPKIKPNQTKNQNQTGENEAGGGGDETGKGGTRGLSPTKWVVANCRLEREARMGEIWVGGERKKMEVR